MASSHEGFPYPPLRTNEDSIRNLTLEPGDFADPLVCSLSTVTFGMKPRYVALSYTWSNPYLDNASLPTAPRKDDTFFYEQESEHSEGILLSTTNEARISVNGLPFSIQHNLFLALCHLRSLTCSLTLWVDFICIDQSNVEERNSQVALMSFVYTRAFQVVAWLGLPYHQSRTDPFIGMAIDWKAGKGHEFASSLTTARSFRYSLEPDPKTFVRLAESAYWTRLWIVQELCLARDLVFLYGPKIWTYEALMQWDVLKMARSVSLPNQTWDKKSEQFEPMVRMLDTRADKFKEMKLGSLIERFSNSGCTELRDRVYGLLGLANDVWPYSSTNGFEKAEPESPLDAAITLQGVSRHRNRFKINYSRNYYDIWSYTVRFLFNQRADAKTRGSPTIVRTAGVIQQALGEAVERNTSMYLAGINQVRSQKAAIRRLGCQRNR